jgi:hypothetical protein
MNMSLYGSAENMANRNLAVMYRPCIPMQITDENKDSGLCVADLRDPEAMQKF